MKLVIVFPDKCQDCGAVITFDECRQEEELIKGGHRLFRVCPHCNKEVRNLIVPDGHELALAGRSWSKP